jgi:hypothetical protein
LIINGSATHIAQPIFCSSLLEKGKREFTFKKKLSLAYILVTWNLVIAEIEQKGIEWNLRTIKLTSLKYCSCK